MAKVPGYTIIQVNRHRWQINQGAVMVGLRLTFDEAMQAAARYTAQELIAGNEIDKPWPIEVLRPWPSELVKGLDYAALELRLLSDLARREPAIAEKLRVGQRLSPDEERRLYESI